MHERESKSGRLAVNLSLLLFLYVRLAREMCSSSRSESA